VSLHSPLKAPQRRFEISLLVIFVLSLPLLNPWVRGDGVGYYAYARAPLIEHNLDFTHDYQFANESFREVRCEENGNPKREYRTGTGHLDNHFTVGPAMLWSPFLLVAHAAVMVARTLGSHIPANGFSLALPLRHGFRHRALRMLGGILIPLGPCPFRVRGCSVPMVLGRYAGRPESRALARSRHACWTYA
jgi:hypothetical protein